MVKIAGVQMDIHLAQPRVNLDNMIAKLRECAGQGAQLVVFPECALPGYCFESLAEARPYAETLPGPATEELTAVCRELGIYCVFGLLEQDGEVLYNATALVGPNSLVGTYRKTHLPFLGIDMHTTSGSRPYEVFQAGDLRVGMLICYDSAFPEASRCLALAGADLIVLPTNWPPGAETMASFAINTRALENQVYYMAVNRIGTERGFRFIGSSRIAAPSGHTLADAGGADPVTLYAEIDPALARNKHIIRVPGKHEIDRLADRHPELYGPLVQPHQLPRPGGRK